MQNSGRRPGCDDVPPPPCHPLPEKTLFGWISRDNDGWEPLFFKPFPWWYDIFLFSGFFGIRNVSRSALCSTTPLNTYHDTEMKVAQLLAGVEDVNVYLGGGNSNMFYFHPYLGKISMLTNIFQMGWSHQPVIDGQQNGSLFWEFLGNYIC